jgi:hypothetical protein
MKMDFNFALAAGRKLAKAAGLVAVLCAGLVAGPGPGPGGIRAASAQATYFSSRSVLADFFPKSQAVSYQRFELTAEQRDRLQRRLGYTLAKPVYTIYVARTGETVDGYALIDEEMGQHLPITFAVKISPQGVEQRLEVMVYRERFGDEVRDPRFSQQFSGKSSADPLRPGEDVVAVSGATISSRAMAMGVRRALVLVDELILTQRPRGIPAAVSANPMPATAGAPRL